MVILPLHCPGVGLGACCSTYRSNFSSSTVEVYWSSVPPIHFSVLAAAWVGGSLLPVYVAWWWMMAGVLVNTATAIMTFC